MTTGGQAATLLCACIFAVCVAVAHSAVPEDLQKRYADVDAEGRWRCLHSEQLIRAEYVNDDYCDCDELFCCVSSSFKKKYILITAMLRSDI